MILQNSVFAHLALRRAPASSQPPTLALQGPPGHPIRAPKGPPRPPKGTPMDPPDPPWSTSGRPSGISKTCSFMIGKRTNQPRSGSGPMRVRLFVRTPLFVFPSSALRFSTWLFSSLSGPSFVAFLAPLGVPGPSPLAQMYPFIQ
jgi:hypothetical protein